MPSGTPDARDAALAADAADPISMAEEAAARIAELTGSARHEVAVVLGTGLAGAAERLGEPRSVFGFSALPGFPTTVAAGHKAEIRSVEVQGARVLVLLGRLHMYEGYDAREVSHPVRTAILSGCRHLVITNASGAVREGFLAGDLVLISDHLNLTGLSPLAGSTVTGPRRRGPAPSPFVDLTEAWSPRLRSLAREVRADLQEGVYAQLLGPNFETPAEIRMLRTIGADLVGMSSAVEAIAARHLGAEVLGVSLVSNVAAGLAAGEVSERAVVEVARERAGTLGDLLFEVIGRL